MCVCVFSVSYVKKLNIPSGVVGACRLDLAYEHFKVCLQIYIYIRLCAGEIEFNLFLFSQEKPHLFQFVPNERQVGDKYV